MAGISELPLLNPNNGTNNTAQTQWLIHYARFFNLPALQPTCPGLVPLSSRWRNNSSSGTWLPSSSMVSLQLLRQPIDADGFRLVLLVYSQDKIYEEHYISKLHFAWPQISCLEATSLRGSRAVFASYGDGLGQVQKFAMRFLTSAHAQAFMCSLKTSLNGIGNIGIESGRFVSELPSTSQFISPNGSGYRKQNNVGSTSQGMSNVYPIPNYRPQVQLQPNYRFTQSNENYPTRDSETRTIPVPPSSIPIIPDLNSDRYQELPKLPDSMDSIYKYHEQGTTNKDPKFFAMLGNLETMMWELGGDLSLS